MALRTQIRAYLPLHAPASKEGAVTTNLGDRAAAATVFPTKAEWRKYFSEKDGMTFIVPSAFMEWQPGSIRQFLILHNCLADYMINWILIYIELLLINTIDSLTYASTCKEKGLTLSFMMIVQNSGLPLSKGQKVVNSLCENFHGPQGVFWISC